MSFSISSLCLVALLPMAGKGGFDPIVVSEPMTILTAAEADRPAPSGTRAVRTRRDTTPPGQYVVPFGGGATKLLGHEVSLTLLSPRPGQTFDASRGVSIEWRAGDFPPASGVALFHRSPGGNWTPIPGARELPFNHPSGEGDRGRFIWRPAISVDHVEIGLGFVRSASRSPITMVVGAKGEYPTIGAALEHARSGDSVILKPGTYSEEVALPAGVNLIGEDQERCVIQSPKSFGIWVVGMETTRISNLTIDGQIGIRNGHVTTGLLAHGARVVVENVVLRRTYRAIVLENGAEAELGQIRMDEVTSGISVQRSRATMKRVSFLVSHGYGVAVTVSNGSVVSLTDFTSNGGTAALLVEDDNSQLDVVRGQITGAAHGIMVRDQGRASLDSVSMADESKFGITIEDEGSILETKVTVPCRDKL